MSIHDGIVVEIENYFANQGWMPLLPLKVVLLRTLDAIGCATIVRDVTDCQDREHAVSVILDAIRRSDLRLNPPPPPPNAAPF